MNNFFFLQAEKNDVNHNLVDTLEQWSSEAKAQTYIIDRPLGENKYAYSHKGEISSVLFFACFPSYYDFTHMH